MMEVHFTPDLQAKIDQLVNETGCAPEELLQDAMAGYVAEIVQTREMLNNRYDDLKNGRVKTRRFRRRGGRCPIARKESGPTIPTGLVNCYDFHPAAALDLNEIWDFIAEDSLDAADQVIADILAGIEAAVAFPNQGHKRRDLTSRPLRFIVVHEYLVAYAPEENPLWVLAVMHGRRNPRVMATILHARE